MKAYAVLDTNVLVSALLTKSPESPTIQIVNAITEGNIVPLYSEEIMAEYNEVLHRRKFPFREEVVLDILRTVRDFGLAVSPDPTGEVLPDMDDLVFYEVVMEKRKDKDAYLVTGNQKHFPKRTYIVTPAEMMEILEKDE